MQGHALFASFRNSGRSNDPGFSDKGWSLELGEPIAVHWAWALDEVLPLLDLAEAEARQGRCAALALAYGSAPAFDPAMTAIHDQGSPLAWLGLYDAASMRTAPPSLHEPGMHGWALSPWQALTSRREYAAAIREIRELISLGETYQVNYTISYQATLSGDPFSLFQNLGQAQGAGFCAFLDLGAEALLSLSPELFFLRQGDSVLARPMKGTAKRGRFAREDEAMATDLAACPKNRAENVMIVDMLRNDLGRVARPGSVETTDMFRVERYPTVLQMTSTVRAELGPDKGLRELFQALFPCASISGAPKIRTMEIIAGLERRARGFYCGALGFVLPGGDAVFNVPIRTLSLDKKTRRIRFQVGGGVTHDSAEHAEYEECEQKMAFIHKGAAEASRPFRLLESLLLDQGRYWLLERHLKRLAESAEYFGFACPLPRIRAELEALARKQAQGRFKARLLLTRAGDPHLESAALPDKRPACITAALAREPVDSSNVFLFHKTDCRDVYDKALAQHPGCREVILWNERGEITEGCFSNVVLRRGKELLTPARECGLLAGTYREKLLDRGVLQEAVIGKEEFARADAVWCINSVRRWMRIDWK